MIGFVVSIAAVAYAIAVTTTSAAEHPNVVIIMADDMGYGDPQCFNPQSKIPTPNIDRFAREGMRFTDAHAPGPLCHMSRYGLMTGRYPFRIDTGRWPQHALIEPGETTLATLAKAAGYRTAMVGKWHVGFDEAGYERPLRGGPVDHGFDSFFGMRASTDIPPYFYIRNDRAVELPTAEIGASASPDWSPIQGRFWRAGGIAPTLKLEDVLPRWTDEAIRVVEQHRAKGADAPLFLYVAYTAPHTPWLPSDEFIGKSGAGLYGDFAAMVDAEVGRLWEAFEKAGMADDTLVVFTSDNGPVWYDDDVAKFGHDSAGGLRGMKADVWEAGHRMPFIVRWPGRVAAGTVSRQTICFTDIPVTLADLWNVPLDGEACPDGFSFLPVLLGRQSEDEPVRPNLVIRAGSVRDMYMIRKGPWKLINGQGSGGFSRPAKRAPAPEEPPGQLYNLAEDPGETKNLYAAHPEIVAELTAVLEQVISEGRSRSIETSAEKPERVARVDSGSLIGKVMCGYQGWFTCEGDGSGQGWTHWARNRRKPFGPGNVTVDLWPDMSEYGPDERFSTGFRHADGRAAEVFSSAHPRTVLRHFEWMRDYGIDGVFLQRFATRLRADDSRDHVDAVLANVRRAADATGRVYCVMYDLSGLRNGEVAMVAEDWRRLHRQMKITDDPSYLHHRGRPLVAVWGVGFADGRDYTVDECSRLVQQLKAEGCSVMLGVPTGWRELHRDAVRDEKLHAVVASVDVISPWTVGRYRSLEGAVRHAHEYWEPDLQWCREHGVDYLPVVFPGFSWHNLNGGELGAIPRLKGAFFWTQIIEAIKAGNRMLYVAMFDEVDEGTAIFKCTNDPPVGRDVEFLGYEVPSDYYLRLAGEAGKLLRRERTSFAQPAVSETAP